MSLAMTGLIDSMFQSASVAERITRTGDGYVDGIWVPGTEVRTSYKVNIQPLNSAEIQYLDVGAERIGDYRVVHVNEGDLASIDLTGDWEFSSVPGRFKTVELDNRSRDAAFSRDYVRLVVSRRDDS